MVFWISLYFHKQIKKKLEKRSHMLVDTTSKLLDGLNCESKSEDNKRKKSWGTFLGSYHFGGRRPC